MKEYMDSDENEIDEEGEIENQSEISSGITKFFLEKCNPDDADKLNLKR